MWLTKSGGRIDSAYFALEMHLSLQNDSFSSHSVLNSGSTKYGCQFITTNRKIGEPVE